MTGSAGRTGQGAGSVPWYLTVPLDFERSEATQANQLLAEAYVDRRAAITLAESVGVSLIHINREQPPFDLMRDIMRRAASEQRLEKLLSAALSDQSIAAYHTQLIALVPPPGTVSVGSASAHQPLTPASLNAEVQALGEQLEDVPRRRRKMRAAGVVATAVVLAVALIGYRLSGQSPASSVASGIVDTCARGNPLSDTALADTGLGGGRPSDFRCPSGMVPVPVGKFCMGSPDDVGNPNEHPAHEVTLSAYCIDRTEVTVKAYAACVAARRCTPANLTVKWSRPPFDDMERYNGLCNRDDKSEHPMNCVDWDQADAYCRQQAHARLPTEAEWEYAARGRDGRTYPWGSERPSEKRLNACGPECLEMVKRDLHEDWETRYITSDRQEATAPVGSFPDGASPFNVLDMAGNVWEWTADVYDHYEQTAARNPRGPTGINPHVFRGGSWRDVDDVYFRAAHRNKAESWERYDNLGFRCAADGIAARKAQ